MTSRRLTPADCVAALPEPELDLPPGLQEDVRAIDLRHAALAIAELDHAAETALVLDRLRPGPPAGAR
jgi:hypothetical protein